jgi:hypothetical protein
VNVLERYMGLIAGLKESTGVPGFDRHDTSYVGFPPFGLRLIIARAAAGFAAELFSGGTIAIAKPPKNKVALNQFFKTHMTHLYCFNLDKSEVT